MNASPIIPTPLAMRLLPGERLLWSAHPELTHTRFALLRLLPGLFLVVIATTLLTLGLYSIWESGSYIPIAISLFSVPFFVAAYSSLTSPIRSRQRMLNAIYGITNQRLIIANSQDGHLFRAVAISDICGIQRWPRKDGFGALEIETNAQANEHLVFDVFLLDGLSHPDHVEQLLVNLTGIDSTSSMGGARASSRPSPASSATI